jgi:hypothetical protein
MGTFTRFTKIDCPETIPCGPRWRARGLRGRLHRGRRDPLSPGDTACAGPGPLAQGRGDPVQPDRCRDLALRRPGAGGQADGGRSHPPDRGLSPGRPRPGGGRRLDQGLPGPAPAPPAPPGGHPRPGVRRRRGQALLRHPQAHAPALLQHHRPQLLGRRKGPDLRLAGRQLYRFHPRGGAPIHRGRPPPRGAVHELERLPDRATGPLRRRGALRRPLRRLE